MPTAASVGGSNNWECWPNVDSLFIVCHYYKQAGFGSNSWMTQTQSSSLLRNITKVQHSPLSVPLVLNCLYNRLHSILNTRILFVYHFHWVEVLNKWDAAEDTFCCKAFIISSLILFFKKDPCRSVSVLSNYLSTISLECPFWISVSLTTRAYLKKPSIILTIMRNCN